MGFMQQVVVSPKENPCEPISEWIWRSKQQLKSGNLFLTNETMNALVRYAFTEGSYSVCNGKVDIEIRDNNGNEFYRITYQELRMVEDEKKDSNLGILLSFREKGNLDFVLSGAYRHAYLAV